MSIIAIAKKDGRACMVADTLTSFGELRQSQAYEEHSDKIIIHQDNYLGIAGSAAHTLVIMQLLKEHEYDFSSREAIFETLRSWHPLLKNDYYLNPKESSDDEYESSRLDALLMNQHGIFGIFSLREVFEYSKFWAIGSGCDFALGAMHTIYQDAAIDAETIAGTGARAAAEFNNACALPLTSYTIELTNV